MKRIVGRTVSIVSTLASLIVAVLVLIPGSAHADLPHPWQIGMQDPATPVADRLQALHTEILWIITAITLFVLGLLIYVCVRFRAKANPVPTRTAHNTVIEILWTVLPIVILMVIAFPSFKLLYFQERVPADAALTLKVTGLQWYWHYAYPDNGNFSFDSAIADERTVKDPSMKLFEVDNEVVLPVGEDIRVQIAGNDVMHSWFVPSLAVQKYAVVGHLNEVWLNVEKEGTYYGECNQICGVNHAFMPIKIHAVSKEAFAAWVEQAKQKFARDDTAAPVRQLASAAGQ
jgi:cytochrome c oxidase subunit 2